MMQSDDITPEKIISEKDRERAIHMMNRFGETRFIRETGFKYYRSNSEYIYPEHYVIRLDNLAPDRILLEGNQSVLRQLLERNGHGNFIEGSGITISRSDDIDDVYHAEFANGDESVTFLIINHDRFERPHYVFLPTHVRTKNEQAVRIILGDKITLHPPSNGDHFFT